MPPTRDLKIDAGIGSLIVLGFLAIAGSNVWIFCASPGADWTPARWVILAGMALGSLGAGALSARVFYRYRIGLAAWMLLFGIHAVGMVLATQIFGWLHPSENAGTPSSAAGINALLMAAALLAALLVRGSVLQSAAKNMPAWMAQRRDNDNATPHLWLFGLYWLSPIAWWAGMICALNFFVLKNEAGGGWSFAFLLCVAIAMVRLSVRIVLLEKNKYSNWRRSPQGWARACSALVALSFVLAGAVTFYSVCYMASRVQDSAFAARVRSVGETHRAELRAMQPPPLPPKENAETIYKLARSSIIPLTQHAVENWNGNRSQFEIARNLTALSFFRQGAALKGIDFGLDWSVDPEYLYLSKKFYTETYLLHFYVAIELRQAGVKGDWRTVADDFRAGLNYARHQGALPMTDGTHLALDFEVRFAQTLAAAVLQPDAHPTDAVLVDLQKALREHLDARTEFASRAVYFEFLSNACFTQAGWQHAERWPGDADMYSWVSESALLHSQRDTSSEAALTSLKMMSRRRMDRSELDELSARLQNYGRQLGITPYSNLHALETLRLLEAALAVKRYQRHHGQWPNALSDCMPMFLTALPADPNKTGSVIQYDPSPPRVYTIGSGLRCAPEAHGYPEELYFQNFGLKIKNCDNGNHVLFLAN